jgi:Domain of unknown function (DUF4194)
MNMNESEDSHEAASVDAAPSVIAAAKPQEIGLTAVIVPLLKGVIYRELDASIWSVLLRLQAQVRDYVAVLGLSLSLDEAEGYAYLRSRDDVSADEEDANAAMPRLVARRPLSFAVSLLLALLRKRLAEFDASGGDSRLVLSRDEVVELIRVFLPAGSNETRVVDQVETHLSKIVDLGFVRKLKASSAGLAPSFEVQRIIKAFVDAQWLAEFDQRLAAYLLYAGGGKDRKDATDE